MEQFDSPMVAPHLIEAARRMKNISPKREPNISCMICEQVIGGILSLRRSNATKEVMMDYLYRLCILYSEWGTEGCKGRVNIETVISPFK